MARDSRDDEQVPRQELERALRHANLTVSTLRDEVLQLGAQLVTLSNKLVDKGVVTEAEIDEPLPRMVTRVRQLDETSDPVRVEFAEGAIDKYAVPCPDIPCAELMPLCKARCCTLIFSLSTQDLDEGIVRWDYGRPYRNLRRADDYCTHNAPGTFGCQVYEHRPAPCRSFDCRNDHRIWLDFDKRLIAPLGADDPTVEEPSHTPADAADQRQAAMAMEELSLRNRYDD
jgi:Fe-S-cluster containining protein